MNGARQLEDHGRLIRLLDEFTNTGMSHGFVVKYQVTVSPGDLDRRIVAQVEVRPTD